MHFPFRLLKYEISSVIFNLCHDNWFDVVFLATNVRDQDQEVI